MVKTTNPLADFATNDNFARFEDGVIEATYLGVSMEEDPFTPGEQRLVYKLEYPDGKIRPLGSKSKRLAKKMLKLDPQVGDKILISRDGEGFDTQYMVRIVKKAKAEEEPEIPF